MAILFVYNIVWFFNSLRLYSKKEIIYFDWFYFYNFDWIFYFKLWHTIIQWVGDSMNSKHSYFLIFLFFFASIIPGIFAAPLCIEEIQNNWTDGLIVDGQYRIRVSPVDQPIVVEVIQGGYFDTRHFCINVDRDPVEFYGELNVRTAPLHIICYKATDILPHNQSPSPSSNGCWQKGETLQVFSLFSDKTVRAGIEDEIRGLSTLIGTLPLFINEIPTDYNVNMSTTAAVTKEYYLFNDSNYTFPLGILFILIGAFLFFATFFNNNIKEFI